MHFDWFCVFRFPFWLNLCFHFCFYFCLRILDNDLPQLTLILFWCLWYVLYWRRHVLEINVSKWKIFTDSMLVCSLLQDGSLLFIFQFVKKQTDHFMLLSFTTILVFYLGHMDTLMYKWKLKMFKFWKKNIFSCQSLISSDSWIKIQIAVIFSFKNGTVIISSNSSIWIFSSRFFPQLLHLMFYIISISQFLTMLSLLVTWTGWIWGGKAQERFGMHGKRRKI